jgi:hypothetical protein
VSREREGEERRERERREREERERRERSEKEDEPFEGKWTRMWPEESSFEIWS